MNSFVDAIDFRSFSTFISPRSSNAILFLHRHTKIFLCKCTKRDYSSSAGTGFGGGTFVAHKFFWQAFIQFLQCLPHRKAACTTLYTAISITFIITQRLFIQIIRHKNTEIRPPIVIRRSIVIISKAIRTFSHQADRQSIHKVWKSILWKTRLQRGFPNFFIILLRQLHAIHNMRLAFIPVFFQTHVLRVFPQGFLHNTHASVKQIISLSVFFSMKSTHTKGRQRSTVVGVEGIPFLKNPNSLPGVFLCFGKHFRISTVCRKYSRIGQICICDSQFESGAICLHDVQCL